jgi:hypothetical protein
MNDENSQRAGVGDLSNSEERRESLADDNKDATEQSMLHTHSPLFELHLYNARELVSILKALCFREVLLIKQSKYDIFQIQMCTFSVINNQG